MVRLTISTLLVAMFPKSVSWPLISLTVLLGAAVVLVVLSWVGAARIREVEPMGYSSLSPLPGARFVNTRSGRVHVLDVGEGPVVVLLHGSGRGLIDWQQGVVGRLARRHRVIALDFYGSGHSERNPRFTYGYDLWAQEIIDVMDALGVPRASVVGHSVGGALACIMASRFPERVERVVTIGTGMEIEPQQFLLVLPGIGELAFADLDVYGAVHSPEHRAALETAFKVQGTRAAMLQYMRRQMTIDGASLLFGVFEDIDAPVLHLSGSRDANISPRAARALAARTGGAFESIEGAHHDVHIEEPEQVAEAIESFLRTAIRR